MQRVWKNGWPYYFVMPVEGINQASRRPLPPSALPPPPSPPPPPSALAKFSLPLADRIVLALASIAPPIFISRRAGHARLRTYAPHPLARLASFAPSQPNTPNNCMKADRRRVRSKLMLGSVLFNSTHNFGFSFVRGHAVRRRSCYPRGRLDKRGGFC